MLSTLLIGCLSSKTLEELEMGRELKFTLPSRDVTLQVVSRQGNMVTLSSPSGEDRYDGFFTHEGGWILFNLNEL